MDILDTPMDLNDAGATTIRAYLTALLVTLWQEDEGFSGKRPFGNSGWKYDVWKALIKGGQLPGTLDGDGYVNEVDTDAGDELILAAIEKMARAQQSKAETT
jgi:hypothetical protein